MYQTNSVLSSCPHRSNYVCRQITVSVLRNLVVSEPSQVKGSRRWESLSIEVSVVPALEEARGTHCGEDLDVFRRSEN